MAYGRQGLVGGSLRASGAQLRSGKWWFFVTHIHTNTHFTIIYISSLFREILLVLNHPPQLGGWFKTRGPHSSMGPCCLRSSFSLVNANHCWKSPLPAFQWAPPCWHHRHQSIFFALCQEYEHLKGQLGPPQVTKIITSSRLKPPVSDRWRTMDDRWYMTKQVRSNPSARGTKRDVENTPKCTRPNYILAQLGLGPPPVGRHRT